MRFLVVPFEFLKVQNKDRTKLFYSKKNTTCIFFCFKQGEVISSSFLPKFIDKTTLLDNVLLYPYAHLYKENKCIDGKKNTKNLILSFKKTLSKNVFSVPFGIEKTYLGQKVGEERFFEETEERALEKEKELLYLFPSQKPLLEEELKQKKVRVSEVFDLLKQNGINSEKNGDKGHHYFFREGLAQFKKTELFFRALLKKIKLPIFECIGTNLFNLKKEEIKNHVSFFSERSYLTGPQDNLVMRYSACFQQFSIAKQFKKLPFGLFEIADSYRYEQSGELELCFRTRKFTMPDMHIFVSSFSKARKLFIFLHELIISWAKKEKISFSALVNYNTKKEKKVFSILNKLKEFETIYLKKYLKTGYWLLNIEYLFKDVDGNLRELATLQIDLKNSSNFGIEIDKKKPIILHCALIGSIERFIFMQYDLAVQQKAFNPWFLTTPIFVLPTSEDFVEPCKKLFKKNLKSKELFCLQGGTVNKRILELRKKKIPFFFLFGQKELATQTILITELSSGHTKEIPFEKMSLPYILQSFK